MNSNPASVGNGACSRRDEACRYARCSRSPIRRGASRRDPHQGRVWPSAVQECADGVDRDKRTNDSWPSLRAARRPGWSAFRRPNTFAAEGRIAPEAPVRRRRGERVKSTLKRAFQVQRDRAALRSPRRQSPRHYIGAHQRLPGAGLGVGGATETDGHFMPSLAIPASLATSE
jgi:hypothetical protein